MIENIKIFADILVVLLIILTLLFSIYKYRLEEYFKTREGMLDKYFFREKFNYLDMSRYRCGVISHYKVNYTGPINIKNYWKIENIITICKYTDSECNKNDGHYLHSIDVKFKTLDSLPEKIPLLYNDVDTYFINKTDIVDFSVRVFIFIKNFFDNTGLTCQDFK